VKARGDDERLARLERAIRRGIELLAQGRGDAARSELVRALGAEPQAAPFEGSVSESELEQAFETAAPEREQMFDADRVAQAAIRQAERDLAAETGPAEVGAAFRTRTLADLLERQGDAAGASQIRSQLGAPAARPAPRGGRRQVMATLERWLENLRRGARP
jgi:hypothetical protein